MEKKPVVPILATLLAMAIGVIIFMGVSGVPRVGVSDPGSTAAQSTSTQKHAKTKPAPDPTPEQVTDVAVPNVVRLDQRDAEKLIANSGLVVGAVDSTNSDDVPAGHVISQDPAALTVVDRGTSVKLVVSAGKAAPAKVTVPDLKGMTPGDAEKALADAKLVAVPDNPVYSDEVDPGLVCTQSVAAGAQLDEGSQIAFSTSLGKENVTVPNLVGMNVNDAHDSLDKVGLGFDSTSSYSDSVPVDCVISQSVPTDTRVAKGTKVTVEVSLGAKPQEKVAVPDLSTYSLDEAKRALDSAGLSYRYTGDVDGTVVSQDPAAGTEVDPGTTVSFTLQEPQTLVAVPDVAGMNGPDARAACEQVGIELDYDQAQPDRVLSGTDPEAGTMVDTGTVVEATYDEPEPEPEVGAWEVYDGATSHVSDDERAIFDSALADENAQSVVPAGLNPISVIATQTVSGTNYAFLTTGDGEWYVVTIYVNTDGDAALVQVDAIDLANVSTTDPGTEETVGGWAVSSNEPDALPSDVQNAYDSAFSEWGGGTYKPIAYLGSQVVSGENHLVLCADDAQLYVATINVNPNGDASVVDVAALNLAAYTS
ncbi:MAG: PASTA domain-containing protein [Atopobiaceae bacterium]|nr:PASTA domain-containing protein [Atopobiaceae bacterium]